MDTPFYEFCWVESRIKRSTFERVSNNEWYFFILMNFCFLSYEISYQMHVHGNEKIRRCKNTV